MGSVYGGTLVTIRGYHFSQTATDNPVRIGYTDCLVVNTSEFQIQCMSQPRVEESEGTDELIVFLRTFEEAPCDACSF